MPPQPPKYAWDDWTADATAKHIAQRGAPLASMLKAMAVEAAQDAAPIYGDIKGINDAGHDLASAIRAGMKGEYGAAAGNTAMAGLGVLGAIPLAGTLADAAKGGVKAAMKGADKLSDAKRVFGLTGNPKEAGYILPDGDMLDFSGRHEMGISYQQTPDLRWQPVKGQDYQAGGRYTDHRDLDQLFTDSSGGMSGNDMMREFNNLGAVRYTPESSGVSLTKKPTGKQLRAIVDNHKAIGGDAPLRIDFDDPKTLNTVNSIEVENPTSAKLRQVFAEHFDKPEPLDMSTAARMDRAREQGYSEDVWYTGTKGDINDVDVDIGRGKSADTGMWLTKDTSTANTYAPYRGGAVYPVHVKEGNDLVVNVGGKNWNDIEYDDAVIEYPDGTQDAAYDVFDFDPMESASTDDIARAARGAGYDSITIRGVQDRGGANHFDTADKYLRDKYGYESPVSLVGNPKVTDAHHKEALAYAEWHSNPSNSLDETRVVFKPQNVRSTFAKFDPAKKNSPNLSAAIAGLMLANQAQGGRE